MKGYEMSMCEMKIFPSSPLKNNDDDDDNDGIKSHGFLFWFTFSLSHSLTLAAK